MKQNSINDESEADFTVPELGLKLIERYQNLLMGTEICSHLLSSIMNELILRMVSYAGVQ